MFILVINPGSTSTKMAVFEDEKPMVLRSITHTNEELAQFDDVTEQLDYRKQLVLNELQRMNVPMEFQAVIGRGGLVKPIAGGVYEINQRMLDDTRYGIAMHNHAATWGVSSPTTLHRPSLAVARSLPILAWLTSSTTMRASADRPP